MTGVTFGLRGTGSYTPEKRLTNEELSDIVDTSDEWITQRTGIKERRILAEGETTSDMCIAAAKIALADAGLTGADLDLIVLGTVTPDRHVPATACKVAKALDCRNIPAFDVAAGCSGFIYSAAIASQFLRAGTCRNVLVLGAEALSRIANYRDRTSCILFGDAAGAAIFSADEWFAEVLSNTIESDGGGYDVMYQTYGGAENPITHDALDSNDHKLVIHGREVYRFAVSRMVELVRGEQAKNPDLKLGAVVPHQVNARIIESAREKLELPTERVFVNIDRYGNTSAASVPLALDQARRTGFFDGLEDHLIVMCAFGAGLTWGSLALRWGRS
ncbi:MAG: 3-oxoacyl-[acyl-carrier-protein] synthase-3 [Pseudohongiellaceae bacterium]|jgi:3-oxoacyl-[acyl-carrier-protein] synthase-3